MRKPSTLPFLALLLGLTALPVSAQVAIAIEETVLIDFESTLAGVNEGPYSGSGLTSSPTGGQLDSDAWQVLGLSDGDTEYGLDYVTGDYARGPSTGEEGTGGLYAFDVGGGNTAFGWQATSDVTPDDLIPGSFTLRLVNVGDELINQLEIDYDLWIYNNNPNSNSCTFSYSLDNANFIAVSALDTASAEEADPDPVLWVEVDRSTLLTDLRWVSGDTLYLRWSTDTLGSGFSDELALDNIRLQSRSAELPRFKADSTLLITFDETVEDVNEGQYDGTGLNPNPAAGQLDADAWQIIGIAGDTSEFGTVQEAGDYARGTSSGGVTTGGLYAFDVGGGNRVFGWQASDNDLTPGSFTLRLINVGDELINQLDLDYEIWVYNDAAKSNSCNFSYSLDGINFTDVSALDLASTETADGSPAWEQFDRSTLFNDLRWVTGDTLYLRWSTDEVSGSGSNDQLALDNIRLQSRSAEIPKIRNNSSLLITFDETVEDVNNDTYAGAGLNPSPAVGQLDADAWQISGLSDGDTEYGTEPVGDDFDRGGSTGGETDGGLYAFDLGGGNTAFGWQASGDDLTPGSFTLRLINAGVERINQLEIDYDIWVFNDQDRSSSCTFAYSLDSTNFLSVSALDFESPGTADGTPGWTDTARSFTLSDLDLEPGDTIYLRWDTEDVSGGTGGRDELALDNISIAATPERRFYRTLASGDWSDFATWENSFTLNGDYEPAETFPTATNSDTIRILERDTIVLNTSISANSIRIDSLGYLRIDTASELTLVNELNSIELDVQGTFQDDAKSVFGVTFESGSAWFLRDFGTFLKTNNSGLTKFRDNYVVDTVGEDMSDFPSGNVTEVAMQDSARFIYRYTGNPLTFISSDMVYPELRFENVLVSRFEPQRLSEVFRGTTNAFVVEGDLIIDDNMIIALNMASPAPPLVRGDLIVGNNSTLITGATFVSPSDTVGTGIEIQGDLIVNGTIDFSAEGEGRSRLTFSGPAGRNHTISGDPDTVILNELVLNKPIGDSVFLETRMTLRETLVLTGAELYLEEGADLTLGTGLVFDRLTTDLAIATDDTKKVNKELDFGIPEDVFLRLKDATEPDRVSLTARNDDGSDNILVGLQLRGVVRENGIGGPEINRGVVSRTWYLINRRNADTLDVEMEWHPESELPGFVDNDFYISRYLDPIWEPQAFGSAGKIIETTNQSVSERDTIILAVGSAGVLPIELLSFDARTIPEGVELLWRTASETDNDFFSIERADDGLVFREIGRLPGAGTTLLPQEYLFVDENPLPGTNYYRLRQVDFNGQFSYSPLRSVTFSRSISSLSALPNPTGDRLTLRWDQPAEPGAFLRIFRMTGEQVYQDRLAEGSNTYEADLSRLAPGLYFVEVQGKRVKVLKQ